MMIILIYEFTIPSENALMVNSPVNGPQKRQPRNVSVILNDMCIQYTPL